MRQKTYSVIQQTTLTTPFCRPHNEPEDGAGDFGWEFQRMCSLVVGAVSQCSRKEEQSAQKTSEQQNLKLEWGLRHLRTSGHVMGYY